MTTGRTRFLLEIIFLIAVAGASAAFHWGPGAVGAAMAGAFVLVVVVEISSLRTDRGPETAGPAAPPPAPPRPAAPPREETWVEALERLGRRAAPSAAEAEAPTRLTLPRRREAPPSTRPAPAPAALGPQAPQLRPPRREPAPPVFKPPPAREAPPPAAAPEPSPREPAPAPPVQPAPSPRPFKLRLRPSR